jgi:hypothetical protein
MLLSQLSNPYCFWRVNANPCYLRKQAEAEAEVEAEDPHPPPTGGKRDSVSLSVTGVAMPCKYSIERPFNKIVM